ncbi:S-methyl-5-thioribose-1-phosphate isomerase [Candidatus Sumerlaeota bacterium]|nr:S-methyl-5-thioribose-1-phosphate isomerase [Candidatus Sumerlaeota bacterium]
MPTETIAWTDGHVRLIDQTLLPTETRFLDLTTVEEIWEAIKMLRVRGAPAIGVAAALGVVTGVKDSPAQRWEDFERDLSKTSDYLASSRPTAVNLFWALDRMRRVAESVRDQSVEAIKRRLLDEALEMIEEDNRVCLAMGEHGASLIEDGQGILTHCNTGGLATAKYGTALNAVFTAHRQGKRVHVYADETRPLLQGARLTAWECLQEGVPCTLICDSMAAVVMRERKVDLALVGSDRIAANGDAANKIGTYMVAVLAKEHGIPFYIVAPLSTVDMSLPSGDRIPIEERGKEEIIQGFGRQTGPSDIEVYNPAFDVTPNHLISGIVTERGIARPPYTESLRAMFE